jgi:hexosaminidase
MKKYTLILPLLFSFILACQPKRVLDIPTTDLTQSAIIPKPYNMEATGSGFPLDVHTQLSVIADDEAYNDVAQYFSQKVSEATGINLNEPERTYSHIVIRQNRALTTAEGYELKINNDSLLLTSGTAEGAFRGIQTIRQLIPSQSNDSLADSPIWVIPTGKIADHPQYVYRGTMLDVARHFFSVEDVKRYLDILAYYKINKFHMHLSDDQGWRIEIKSWPKLTEVGSTTGVGGGPGGFYTQEEFKEIVAYAAERFITIIPEIDMPGHTNAASLAYPFLNGNGKEIKIETSMAVGYSTFDTRKDTVYAFIDDVIREISAMTPGPYFHIGGDESHATEKDDYVYFVNKVEKIVQKYGKRMIGWDEVATADVSSSSIAQFWSNEKNAQEGIDKNMKLIISLAKNAYLDMKYDKNSEYGLTWAGFIPVDVGYNWSPEEMFTREHVLGVEAPLWGETIRNFDELSYLAFPRVIGYAELGWSVQDNREWEDYKERLAYHGNFLRKEGIQYYPSPLIEWGE